MRKNKEKEIEKRKQENKKEKKEAKKRKNKRIKEKRYGKKKKGDLSACVRVCEEQPEHLTRIATAAFKNI